MTILSLYVTYYHYTIYILHMYSCLKEESGMLLEYQGIISRGRIFLWKLTFLFIQIMFKH